MSVAVLVELTWFPADFATGPYRLVGQFGCGFFVYPCAFAGLSGLRPMFSPEMVQLFEFTLSSLYFQHGGTLNEQPDGVAMGSPIPSPVIANFFMDPFEGFGVLSTVLMTPFCMAAWSGLIAWISLIPEYLAPLYLLYYGTGIAG